MNILALVLVVLPLAASQLIGGPMTVDVNRDDIQQIASFALTQLNTLLGTQNNTLVSVVQAKTQVVAGINYFLTLEIKNGQETQTCTVTVWSRVWLNDTQVTQHACTSRSKRNGLVGAITPVNVTRTDILKMATYAVTTLNGLQGTDNSLDQVISAKTQVVSGTNYFLKISMSNGSQTQICDVTIWDQPWSYMTQMTHHSCVNTKRRDIGMPGGLFNADVNSSYVKNMTNFALGELNRLQGSQNSIVEVISAKTQVVAGMNYFLKIRLSDGSQTQICDVTIWDQPWTNMTQMTHHSCVNVKRRDIGMPGGLFNADVNSSDVKNMTNFALGELNRLQGSQNSIVEIISAKTQVVAGMNYFLKIRLSDGSQTQICDVTIWDQPWTNMTQMTHHSCVIAKRRDIGIFGGVTKVDVNSTEVRNVANFALGEINRLQGAQNSIEQIIWANARVVAGMNYTLTMRLKEGDKTQICFVKIWSQPWLHRKEMTEHSCSQVTKRAGGLLGGVTPVSTKSGEIKQAANFAVTEINGIQGAQNSLVKVVKAGYQVVGGFTYILTLKLQNGNKTQLCEVGVWSPAWTSAMRLTDHHCTAQTKRQLGAVTDADVNDNFIQMLAKYALQTTNALDGTSRSYVELISAKTQVVAGTNYFFKIRVSQGTTTQICDVTIWDQPWTNMTQLTHHSCVNAKKRDIGIFGGLFNADINSAEVRNMANFALGEINRLQGAQNSIEEIIWANTTLVAGMNYFLKIRMSDGSQTQICDVTIWDPPWTHMTQMTHHSCVNAKRRDIGIFGGVTNVGVNSTEVRNMANFALGEINGLQGAQNSIEEIIWANTQVVAGMNYILTLRLKKGDKTQICYVKIWSQPWLHRKEMTEHSCSHVTKRAGGLLGGPTDVDVNSAEIQEVANFAVTEINGIQGAQNSLVKVVNARKQIVSGINYILTLSLQNGDKTQLCEVRVWYQSWTNTKQVTDHHCSAVSKRSAQVLGGVEPAHLSAPMQQAVSFVEDALNGKMNSMFRMVTEKVDQITQQVVSGMKNSFDLHLVTSSCMNNPDGNGKGITDCPTSNSTQQRMTCRVSVLYQAWSAPKFHLLSDTCGQLA